MQAFEYSGPAEPAPWFEELSETDAEHYLATSQQVGNDLLEAATFFSSDDNRRVFPVAPEPTEITYFVLNGYNDNPREKFEMLASQITVRGGSVLHRPGIGNASTQHIASLPFGSGRVVYRVVWIEHEASTDE